MAATRIAYIPSSHLDLFWLGNYKTCLARGAELIKQYIDRCLATPDETFLLESVVFAEHFLESYPEYRDILVRLVGQGRVEVGAAYVDRWEHLILGESHIRNIQIGKNWCREALGLENTLVTHPDLPGLVPQTAQIYAQAGIQYYVTSRKMYAHGAVWRYRSPDGSTLLMLNWPRHYVYVPLDLADVPAEVREALWVRALDLEATRAGFPLGVIPISGSAGDLANRETFRDRYGAMLEQCVTANRARYPELEFSYAVPSQVLAPYTEVADLPEHVGDIPSVWGVAADEEVAFFQRDRVGEGLLLTAETLAVVAEHLGLDWRPPTAPTWQGAFHEGAFFGRTDPIQPGREFEALWRMHVITQDHNGGGQEGALSTFQKRVIQERLTAYSREIIDHVLDRIAGRLMIAGDCLLVFNPHGHEWSDPVTVSLPVEQWDAGDRVLNAAGQELAAQVERRFADMVELRVEAPPVPSVGYQALAIGRGTPAETAPSVRVGADAASLNFHSQDIELTVDRHTGSITGLRDIRRGQDWGGAAVGALSAWYEIGNDVTLRMDPARPPLSDSLIEIGDPETGPLFTRVRIHKTLHHAAVEQTVTLWAHTARVDIEVHLFWWGAHDLQLRLGLPSVPDVSAITYGTPFHGTGWADLVPSAAPRNRDEILGEDYARYREVQGWLHLEGASGGLTICTAHPGFHHDADRLSAVLMRTSLSCGDARLYWENAGEQVYTFVLLPGERGWRDALAPRHGAAYLKPAVVRLCTAEGTGRLPTARSFLQVDGDGVLLSSLYPSPPAGAAVARVYDAVGAGAPVNLRGRLAEQSAMAVHRWAEAATPLEGERGAWRVDLPPWRIQTVLLGR